MEKIFFGENDFIELPDREPTVRHVLESYGGLYLLSRYCGLKKPRYFFKRPTFWQHGWGPDFTRHHPLMISGEILSHGKMSKEPTYLVAKKEDEEYLKSCGYKNAKAIGLQVIYLPKADIKRQPNTLLVMPVHSLSYVQHNHWKFKEYVDDIIKVRKDFDKVVICVHPDCVKNGYWVNEFKQEGFEIVEGAFGNDKNSLFRLQKLTSSFEYVTTNGFGSHIAYAAYFGAKVSIYGVFAEHRAEDYEEMYKSITFNEYINVHKQYCNLCNENSLKKNIGFLFFQHPKNAIELLDWGKKEVGFYEKKTANEMKSILGWGIKYMCFNKDGLKYYLAKYIPENIKKHIKRIFYAHSYSL